VKTVEVVTKQGCHLCDILLGELDELRKDHGFVVSLTYIEDHPAKMTLFGNDIPVVLVDENEVCRHSLDRDALLARLTDTESNTAG
jgi:hypothetical protein